MSEKQLAYQIIAENSTYSDAYFSMLDAGIENPDLYWYSFLEDEFDKDVKPLALNCMGAPIIYN